MANHRHLSVDARLAGPRNAGIGRYTSEILNRLLSHSTIGAGQQRCELVWHVWLDAADDAAWLTHSPSSSLVLHRTTIRHYSVAEQTLWPQQLASVPSDLIWVPHFNVPLRCPFPWVVTIHDLLWHQQRQASATTLPAWQHLVKHWGYRLVSSRAIKGAEKVLVPSFVVAKEIHQRFGKNISVEVTSEGVPEIYFQANLAKRDISSPKILVVGSMYPHKNIEVVLQALRHLPKFTLDIASARTVFTDRVLARAKQLGVSKQVKMLGYVRDEDLKQAAGSYVALLQPSLSEGFGLTGLEAMALGIPVVASELPIFSEIYQHHARSFPPHDAFRLCEVLEELWQNPPSESVRKAAQKHAHTFTWDKAAEKTWLALENAWKAIPHNG